MFVCLFVSRLRVGGHPWRRLVIDADVVATSVLRTPYVSLQLGSRGLKSVLYTLNVCLFFITLLHNFLFVQNTLFWFQHFSAIVAIVTLCRSAFLHTGHDKPVSSLATPGSFFYFLRYHLTGVFLTSM